VIALYLGPRPSAHLSNAQVKQRGALFLLV